MEHVKIKEAIVAIALYLLTFSSGYAQDLDDLLKGALKDYLEEKAEEAGISIPGKGKPKNVEFKFSGAEPASTDSFEALYTMEESTEPVIPKPVADSDTPAERACFDRVQGKIAWNTAGAKTWNPRNIKKLCDGATNPSAPPGCFYTAMFRGAQWGQRREHSMNWMRATQLCAKTSNAATPISCLKGRLAANYSLQSAINACDSNPRTVAVRPRPKPAAELKENECYNYVQGRIAWDPAKKNKTWNKANVKRLCKATTSKFSPGNCFSYAMHGGSKWGKRPGDNMTWSKAIDLCEGTSNANKTTTCFKKEITRGRSLDQAIARCDR